MAPEVQEGERATPRSDLYSAGVVLRDHLDARSPERLRRLVERLTETDPGLRPPSAERALAYLDGDPAGAAHATVRTEAMDALWPEEELDPPRRVEGPPKPTDTDERPALPPPRRELAVEGRHVLAGLALLAAVIAAVAIATSGGGDPDGGETSQAPAGGPQQAAESEAPAEESTPAPDTAASDVVPPPKPNGDPAKGAELEEQAFATLGSGDAEGAVKAYEKALREFPADARTPEAFGEYPSYAYALYSYGDALLQVGRADEAVAVLEERLAFDDQRETVEALLAEARAQAGE
jgi:tetratricopeptide (TPR) repeat protein